MCTFDRQHRRGGARVRDCAGVSLIELLLGLALALCLALAIGPLWISLQSTGVRESDRTIWMLQGRVAGARFERDGRLAGAAGCPFASGATVLEATPSQVVLLVKTADSSPPVLVEWEFVGGSLMRRWGPCPNTRPTAFGHSLYIDNKTMLEHVDPSISRFSYRVGGFERDDPLAAPDLAFVDTVTLELGSQRERAPGATTVAACARIGW